MRKRTALLAALWGLALGGAGAQAQDNEGQIAFNNACRTCHTLNEGDNRLGPTLYGIIGKTAGSEPGYNNYSSAMTNAGLTWDEDNLDRFIESPDAVVPGNNMKPYPGIANAEERQKIVSFLKERSDGG